MIRCISAIICFHLIEKIRCLVSLFQIISEFFVSLRYSQLSMFGVRMLGSGQLCFWIAPLYRAIGYLFTMLEEILRGPKHSDVLFTPVVVI